MIDNDAANSEKRDQILELRRSDGWHLVYDRLSEEVERRRDELEQASLSERRSDFLRGQIAAIKIAIDVPDILLDEYKEPEEE